MYESIVLYIHRKFPNKLKQIICFRAQLAGGERTLCYCTCVRSVPLGVNDTFFTLWFRKRQKLIQKWITTLLTYRSVFGLFATAHALVLCVTLCCRTRPSNPQSLVDIKRISTGGGTEHTASDIKVSSHDDSCHIIYMTWHLNVNFQHLYFFLTGITTKF